MPNKIKFGIDGNEQDSIFKGDWALDISPANTGGGPSTLTGLYNGPIIPDGGWAIYYDGIVFVARNDDEFLSRIGDLGGPVSSKIDAMDWVALHNNIMVVSGNITHNTVREGIVLDLDVNNPTSFMTSNPTTNIVSNWDLSTGWSKGYQTDIVFDEIPPPHGVDAPTVGFNKNSVSSYWYSYGDYAGPQTGGVVYTVSMYVKTLCPNFTIGAYVANNSEAGRASTPHVAVPNDNEWHRIVFDSFTSAVGNESDSLSFNFNMGSGVSGSNQSRTWFCAPQMEIGTEATAFVKGTRAESTLMYSLGHSDQTHTLQGAPTFSNGGITLNETQGIRMASMPTNVTNATVVIWYKTTDAQELWVKGNTGSYYIAASHSGGNYYHQNSGSPTYYIDAIQTANPTDFKNGKYHMFEAKNVDFTGWDQLNWFLYGSDWNMNGTVAKIMIYDRSITAEESKQNYHGGPIVTDNLLYAIDAGNLASYESGSIIADNLLNWDTSVLYNGVGFNKGNGGYWTFDGSNDYIQTYLTGTYSQITYEFMGFFDDNTLNTKSRDESVFGDWIGNSIHFGTRWSVGMHWNVNGTWNEIPATNLKYGWNHYVLVWDHINNKKLVYLNGILSDSKTTNGNITMQDFRIGVATNLNKFYRGNIPSFKIYNKALTESEVLQNFAAQRNRFDI